MKHSIWPSVSLQRKSDPGASSGQAVEHPADAAAGLPGWLNRVTPAPAEPGRIVLSPAGDPSSLEKFRFLAHRIEQARQKRHLSSLLITSPGLQEGKTVIAINLAILLARTSRALLIDCDLRQGGASGLFGLGLRPGLAECLADTEDIHSVVCLLDPFGLAYLPAGTCRDNPADLLCELKVRQLLQTLGPSFDWVILDSPPLNMVAETACLASICDGTVLVVRAGLTRREDVEQAAAILEGSYLAGVVLNGCDDPQGGNYHSYRGAPAREAETPGAPGRAKS